MAFRGYDDHGNPIDDGTPEPTLFELHRADVIAKTIEEGKRIKTDTVPGGAYRMPDGKWVDANGAPLTDEQVAAHEATLAERGA